jgi:hypothetical protein
MNTELAAEGLKLLTRKDRERLNYVQQVMKLRRIAVRAMSDADWRAGIPSKQHPQPPKRTDFSPEQDAHIASQRYRAAIAIAAMQQLNTEHQLGY